MIRRSALLLSLGLAVAASSAQALPVPGQALSFTVLRDGEKVGSNTITFQRTDGGVQVDVATNIVVKVALIPVYRFEHQGHELWQGERLVSLTSATNDDGTRHTLAVQAKADGLEITGDGQPAKGGAELVPGSLWNPAVVRQSQLLNSLDGHLMKVDIRDLGEDKVEVRGTTVAARHYAVDGDLKRELWYDGQGALVQVRFKAKDDSEIRYVLR